MDRVHRIGQRHPVTVYRLLAQSTIEARIVSLNTAKLELAQCIVNDSNAMDLAQEEGAFVEIQ
jgi:SNF2 family DNA or RNA helicase